MNKNGTKEGIFDQLMLEKTETKVPEKQFQHLKKREGKALTKMQLKRINK